MPTTTEIPLVTPAPSVPNPIVARKIAALRNLISEHVSPARQELLAPVLRELFENPGVPASSSKSRHGCFEGGLISHIVDVANVALAANAGARSYLSSGTVLEDLMKNAGDERGEKAGESLGESTAEAVVTVAILHDLEKIRDLTGQIKYVPNILKNGTQSDKVPFQISDTYDPLRETKQALDTLNLPCSALLFDRCSESIFPSGLVSLSIAEQMSPGIVEALSSTEQQAIIFHAGIYDRVGADGYINKEHPLTLAIHYADMIASRLLS